MSKPRNYKKEHKAGGQEAKDKRASRNRARLILKKSTGGIPKGMQVHHVNGNPRDNSKKNLAVVSKKVNRTLQPKRKKYGR
jgi:hypothetical protein